MSHGPVDVRALRGRAIGPYLDDVARLRIEVFRDWPYLYDGDVDYERRYLAHYAASDDSVFVLASDGGRIVGAATGLPLAHDADAFRAPFAARGIAADEVFYCGESVLLPEWRGQGVGHAFFDAREAHARALGRFRWIAFAAVDRAPDDPRRPPGARANDAFWQKRGYARQAGMTMQLAWRELGADAESTQSLTFWLRPLDGG